MYNFYDIHYMTLDSKVCDKASSNIGIAQKRERFIKENFYLDPEKFSCVNKGIKRDKFLQSQN